MLLEIVVSTWKRCFPTGKFEISPGKFPKKSCPVCLFCPLFGAAAPAVENVVPSILDKRIFRHVLSLVAALFAFCPPNATAETPAHVPVYQEIKHWLQQHPG